MKKFIIALVAAASLVSFSSERAAAMDLGPREGIGAVLGGVLGGLGGSQIGKGSGQLVATGVGAVAGMLIGRDIGRQLDRVSAMHHARTTQGALERNRTGRTSAWRNPDQRTRGSITPVRTYRSGNTHCREYTQTIIIGGEAREGVGTACREPDGTWRIR